MVEFLYDAFISYRRSDGGATARWLRRQLEAFRPRRALRDRLPRQLRVYMDTAYERGATDFFDNTIRPALLASHFLIVVATPDAVLRPSGQDDWIKREIDEFTQGPNGENTARARRRRLRRAAPRRPCSALPAYRDRRSSQRRQILATQSAARVSHLRRVA